MATILIDLDGIVVDLHTHWHERARRCCPTDMTLDAVLQTYDGWTGMPCADHVFTHLDGALFLEAYPMPGAVEAIRQLDAAYDVVIVTASAVLPETAAAKLAWVEHHLGLDRYQVIVAQRKELIRGDALIDDAPKNLSRWIKMNPEGFTATIAYEYNRDVPASVFRAESWKEPEKAWREILQRIEKEFPT